MIVTKCGQVIIEAGKPIRIENWEVQREPSDPAAATTEQLLLAFAIDWAYDRFVATMNSAAFKAINEARKTVVRQIDPGKVN